MMFNPKFIKFLYSKVKFFSNYTTDGKSVNLKLMGLNISDFNTKLSTLTSIIFFIFMVHALTESCVLSVILLYDSPYELLWTGEDRSHVYSFTCERLPRNGFCDMVESEEPRKKGNNLGCPRYGHEMGFMSW
ncbi:hypothetical protein CHS0354_032236 [Potamilus streckersoni]|uniref:Uncharacterized protein n=1 Tax=Potamilus streckersoni TaxID=2493646 RepID=A0AAE0RPL3_9BIVA|nr:hypothetical protein CHS0354_032236 [Potamilus streckersoni]